MKYCILFVCLLFTGSLHAQQAKAYELLHYVAESDGHTYLLDYADGYPAASSIKIKRSNLNSVIFQPVNGAADNNGNLTFISLKDKQSGRIVLHGIDENSIAPPTFKATCLLKGRKVKLKFNQAKG